MGNWQPLRTYDPYASQFWPQTNLARVGQFRPPAAPPTPLEPAPPTPLEKERQNQRFLDQIAAGFREITPALVLTGLVIGIASGAGSVIGTALGTIFVDRVIYRRQRR